MIIERGTTQEVRITIKGWDLTGSDIYVTFKQGARALNKKNMESVTYADRKTTIVLVLSQEDTMFFPDNSAGKIQVRWVDASGDAHKTETADFSTDVLLYDAVIEKEDDGDG